VGLTPGAAACGEGPGRSQKPSGTPGPSSPCPNTEQRPARPHPRDARRRDEGETELLDAFDEVWEALVPAERREVLHALIDRVGFDPESSTLRVTAIAPRAL